MNTTIKAHFKQATVKGGVAVLQQEELDFGDEYEDEPLPFDEELPANVDAETGEIYDPIEDENHMLTEGGN